jgi:hypothetical protein
LQLLQRLALQVLEALQRLARRPRTAPAEPETAGADEEEAAEEAAEEDAAGEEAAGEDGDPGKRRVRRAERRSSRAQRRDA